MKNVRPAFVALLSLAFVAALPGAVFAQPPCANPVGYLTRVQPGVEITRVATKTATAVASSTRVPVCSGDLIELRDNAKATLHISDTPIALDQNSQFRVTAPAAQGGNTIIELLRGALFYLSRLRRPMEIRTPFVTAAIEGTEFVVRVDDDRATVTVLEGIVRASNMGGSLTLTAGQQAVASSNQVAPQLQVPVSPRDAVQWALYYEPLRQGDSFDQLPQVAPGAEDAAFLARRASLLLAAGQLEEARADLDRAQKLDPASADVLGLRTVIAVALNDVDGALTDGRQAVERAPKSATAHLAYSYALQSSFDLEAARRTMEEAVAAEPMNGSAWARLAELRLMLDDVGGAADAGEQAAKLAPNLSRTHEVAGFTSLARLDLDGAATAFDRAIELAPGNPMAHLGTGLVKIRRGHLAEGRADLETAVALSPRNALLRSYLGKAYFDEKRDAAAAGEFDLAKTLDPTDPTAFFYSAIQQQTLNQPVEALQNLLRSIELNDNRVVYRSRLLLDSDLAARSSRLGLIYRDLGFERLALLEGWKSVDIDARNHSAHRLLADNYLSQPRHQIARDSELLQAQLLQPLNINPVQPRLADNGLTFLDDIGISGVGFNEYTRLFVSNQLRFLADGLVGTQSTAGSNLIVSGILNRLSYSAGHYHFDTDGIRDNHYVRQNVFNVFLQGQLSRSTSVQVEARGVDIDKGDRRFTFFDSQNALLSLRNAGDITSIRAGGRHQFAPGSVLIGSYAHRRLDALLNTGTGVRNATDERVDFAELRHLQEWRFIDVSAGIGHYAGSLTESRTVGPITLPTTTVDTEHTNAYVYSTFRLHSQFSVIAGITADKFDRIFQREQGNPKFGFIWRVTPDTTIRGAAFRAFKRTIISSQTLEPTHVAGFNQFFDDSNATDSSRYGLAVDQELGEALFFGAEGTLRELTVPTRNTQTGVVTERPEFERTARAYIYLTPHRLLSIGAEYRLDRLERDSAGANPELLAEATTHKGSLEGRIFLDSGVFGRLRATYADQRGHFQVPDPPPPPLTIVVPGSDRFWSVDGSAGYRLPRQLGVVAVDATNIFDTEFNFQDSSPEDARLLPRRTVMFRFTLSF